MDLEIRHLKLMIALSQTASMTDAAEKLHLTQSALSHQLKDAEEKVGTPLFFRKNMRLVLTPAGERMVKVAQDIVGALSNGIKEVRQTASPHVPPVRLSTGCYTCYHWLPPVLKKYSEKYPEAKIHVSSKYSVSSVEALKRGKVDLVVVNDEIHDNTLEYSPLFTDELLVIMHPGHRLASKKYVTAHDLKGEDAVIYNISDKDSTLLNDILKPAKVSPGRVTRMELTEGIIELVKAGMGIGLLAQWMVQPYLNNGSLIGVPVGKNGFSRTWKVVTSKKNGQLPHIKDLMGLLKSELKMHS